MKKRLIGLVSFLTILFSTGVLAQSDSLKPIYEGLGWISVLDLSKAGIDLEATFWAKILIWFSVFTIFYFSGSKTIFKDNKKVAGILAAIIGLFIIFVPSSLFRQLFQTYTTVLMLVMFGLPVAALFFFLTVYKNWIYDSSPRTYHISAAGIGLILMFILNNLDTALIELDIEALLTFTNWIAFVYAFLNLFVIYHIIMLFAGGGSGETSGFDPWDWIKGKIGKKDKDKEEEEDKDEEGEEKGDDKEVPKKKRKRRKAEYKRMLKYLENTLLFLKETHELLNAGNVDEARKRFGVAKRNIGLARNKGIGFLQKILSDVSSPVIQDQIKFLESELLRLSELMKRTDLSKHPKFLDHFKNAVSEYIAVATALMKQIKVY